MNKNKLIDLNSFHIPRWNELPDIDLYLDQVVNLINSNLSPFIFFNIDTEHRKENTLLTKTMINNYVKNQLIDAPIKKKYSKIQLAKLFVICILKQVYTMNEIKTLLNIALENSNFENTYNNFCQQFEQALNYTYNKKDFIGTISKNDNQYLLKSVLLSCSYKIYVQNITHQ